MRAVFKEYYRPAENEFEELWDNCVFVPDANVLLSLYRYSSNTTKEFMEMFKILSEKKRIWIPHQVGFEYHKNRLGVINEQVEAYDTLIKEINSSKDQLKGRIGRFNKHPFIKMGKINRKIDGVCSGIITELEKNKSKHPDLTKDDVILSNITEIFNGQIGKAYGPDEVTNLYAEGNKRYAKKIPPGYNDIDKTEEEKFGDFIVWLQIIDKAKEINKPIILITDDVKDDWWLIFKGQTIGPRPELVKEISENAKVNFYMYQSDRFLEYAKKHLKQDITQQTINEIRDYKRVEKSIEDTSRMFIDHRLRVKLFNINSEMENIEQQIAILNDDLNSINRIIHKPEISDNFESEEEQKIWLSQRRRIIRDREVLKQQLIELNNSKLLLEKRKANLVIDENNID